MCSNENIAHTNIPTALHVLGAQHMEPLGYMQPRTLWYFLSTRRSHSLPVVEDPWLIDSLLSSQGLGEILKWVEGEQCCVGWCTAAGSEPVVLGW